MGILGVDPEKCIQCGDCIADCPAKLFTKTSADQIEFNDPLNGCISCGHCIAVCPTDAIQREYFPNVDTFPEIQHVENLIPPDTLLHFLQGKRSVRRFKADKIPPLQLEKIYSAMKFAASGHNDRTLNYMMVSNVELIQQLSQKIGDEIVAHPGFSQLFGEWIKNKRHLGDDPIFHKAPHVLFLYSKNEMEMEGLNAAISLTYAMLMAQSLGIGSCWIGLANLAMNSNKDIKKMIGIKGKIWAVGVFGIIDVKYSRLPPRNPINVKEPTLN